MNVFNALEDSGFIFRSSILHSTLLRSMFQGMFHTVREVGITNASCTGRLYVHQGGPLALQSAVQLNHGGLSFYDLWYVFSFLSWLLVSCLKLTHPYNAGTRSRIKTVISRFSRRTPPTSSWRKQSQSRTPTHFASRTYILADKLTVRRLQPRAATPPWDN